MSRGLSLSNAFVLSLPRLNVYATLAAGAEERMGEYLGET